MFLRSEKRGEFVNHNVTVVFQQQQQQHQVMISGELEAAQLGSGGRGPLMCVYSFQAGHDWSVVQVEFQISDFAIVITSSMSFHRSCQHIVHASTSPNVLTSSKPQQQDKYQTQQSPVVMGGTYTYAVTDL